ncbi:MAG: pyridoxal phosphate-dependent aminotransferase [Bacteroidales bacterium]|nr:pyridoxal phosphate-dependent aminotransferase [Bacteroidales bacterium]HPI85083.1 pyridoxal phosphate-dependent aminotransferase [Bacteroidales bacterium]
MELVAQRILNLSESETLAMTRRSRELAAEGIDVINLSIGEPDFNTPEPIKQAAIKAIHDNKTHYPPVPGYIELRKAICHKLKRDNNLDFTPEQIVVSTGAKHSIANVIISLVNAGEEVVLPAPYWVSYKEMVKLARGVAVFVPATVETDFKITPEQLEAAITPKTKVVLYSSPCNPTGSVYSREELEALARVVARHPQVVIISDEIYELINFDCKHESIAQFDFIRNQVVVVNGVSKGFAMTGWRLGYLAAPLWIAKACDKLQGQMTSATSSISQYAAIEAMLTEPGKSPDIRDMVFTFRQRRNKMLDLLKTIPGLVTNVPKGAFYFFPDVTFYFGKKYGERTISNACDLANYLLEVGHVALVPGDAFGNPDCIRISYATSMELLTEAVERMKKALSELK